MRLTSPRTDRPPPASEGGTAPLVHTAVRAAAGADEGRAGTDFLARRLAFEVGTLPGGGERAALNHLACLLGEGRPAPADLADALLLLAGAHEKAGRLDEASTALDEAAALHPERAEIPLHAARLARKRGDAERARSLYRSVRRRTHASASLARMATVGEAILAADPDRSLGRALREAVRAGDAEAAAVAQEERARVRRSEGDRAGALRDYLVSAARFPDPVDRARVLHEAADLLSARGDLLGARELLLVALRVGRREQRDHARGRLHTLARALGDELGRRRWAGSRPAPLVSLTPSRSLAADASMASSLRRDLLRLGISADTPASGH